ncbi:uncharacterized protein LOC111117464 [Crassostrea virginica]
MTGLMESVGTIRTCQIIYIYVTVLLMCVVPGSLQLCKWSNENCQDGSECCSQGCERAHEGTSSRCLQSGLRGPCYADFHCQEYLQCGTHYHCCSPFWGVCTQKADCCDPDHVCRSEKGFYYRLCLGPVVNSGMSTFDCVVLCKAVFLCLVISCCAFFRL